MVPIAAFFLFTLITCKRIETLIGHKIRILDDAHGTYNL